MNCKDDSSANEKAAALFQKALTKIAQSSAASSRDAIQASKVTKPSLHTRFVYDCAKGRV
jgi:flagellar biosynthesis regulator FlaF